MRTRAWSTLGVTLVSAFAVLVGAAFVPATAQSGPQAATPLPTGTLIAVCPGAPPPRLIVGEQARVTPGSPDNVRSMPSKKGEQVTQVFPGDWAFVTGGPKCADGFLWWPVFTGTGFQGWIAEGSGSSYFLEPTTTAVQRFEVPKNADSLTISYHGISLTYPGPLAKILGQAVSATTVLDFKGVPDSPIFPDPEHTAFTFGAVDPKNIYNLPTLLVYNVSAINKLGPDDQKLLDTLRQMFKNQPDPTPIDSILGFPQIPAGQVFHAKNQYLNFQGGSGIRFVPFYAQDVGPLTGDRLSYTFYGLTDDGKYYVALTIPLTTSVLQGNDKAMPNESDPNIGTLYPAYVKQTVAKLDKAGPKDFSPSLDDLDALAQSITIGGSQ
ncbi:MAG: hypothetical protein ACYDBJ_24665 [Aggregatilineales bacterium]